MSTSPVVAAAGVAVLLGGMLAACAAPEPEPSPSAEIGVELPDTPSSPQISGPIDIGDGRSLHLECRGTGSPTVLLVSGTRGAADEWETQPADSLTDTDPTFEALAEVTRVCAYDRPGTLRADGAPTTSTAVPQPTTARQGADDLHALMAAIDDPGPYVVVGLSWGGMIAQQFARTHADDVEGIVLLDSASVYLPETLSPEQWSSWMAIVQGSADAAGSEVPDYPASIAELNGSPRPPEIPATVVSSDEEWDLEVTPGASTWPAWVEAQERLAAFWGAEHLTDTDSGHGLPVEQPALVTAAILDVVDAVRGR